MQTKRVENLQKEKQKLLADNVRLRRVVELANKVLASIAENSLWKAIEKLCAKTATALRALADALDIATDKEKKPLGRLKPDKGAEEIDVLCERLLAVQLLAFA